MSAYKDYMELKTLFRKCCKDEVPMSPEVKCLYWSELKHLERGTRCRNADGSRCMKNCRECEKQRDGAQLSLEQMLEAGELPQDTSNVEELVERMDLLDALNAAIGQLSEKDQMIVVLSSQGYSGREIGKLIGMNQKTVNNHWHACINELRTRLEDHR